MHQNGQISVYPSRQYAAGEAMDEEDTIEEKRIRFEQVTVSYPTATARDGSAEPVMPQDARLRNLTYACPLKVEVHVEDITRYAKTQEIKERRVTEPFQAFIGNLPMMLKARFCHLAREGIVENDPAAHGECQFDMGGYFIINGAEKVVIAQVPPAARRSPLNCRPPLGARGQRRCCACCAGWWHDPVLLFRAAAACNLWLNLWPKRGPPSGSPLPLLLLWPHARTRWRPGIACSCNLPRLWHRPMSLALLPACLRVGVRCLS